MLGAGPARRTSCVLTRAQTRGMSRCTLAWQPLQPSRTAANASELTGLRALLSRVAARKRESAAAAASEELASARRTVAQLQVRTRSGGPCNGCCVWSCRAALDAAAGTMSGCLCLTEPLRLVGRHKRARWSALRLALRRLSNRCARKPSYTSKSLSGWRPSTRGSWILRCSAWSRRPVP